MNKAKDRGEAVKRPHHVGFIWFLPDRKETKTCSDVQKVQNFE
jgi:hypothetical protein